MCCVNAFNGSLYAPNVSCLALLPSADPTAASLAEEVQRQANAAAAAAAGAAPKKRGGAGSRKRTATAAAAADDTNIPGSQDNDAAAAAAGAGAAPAKRSRGGAASGGAAKAKKEYMPRAGTANYAFMVALYLVGRSRSLGFIFRFAKHPLQHIANICMYGASWHWQLRIHCGPFTL
jgi:hypothetical protein